MGIFKKRDKWWIGYRGPDRKWHREPVGASHKLAEQVLAKRVAEVVEGRFFPERASASKSFAEIADKFWDLHLQHTKSDSWRPMLDQAKARFAGMKACQVKPLDVQRYYNEIAERASNSTANRHRTMICSLFNHAKKLGYYHAENPCLAVKKRKEASHRLRYLGVEEVQRLLAAAHPRLRPLLVCAVMTGMRRGEIFGMRWENVDLRAGIIYLLETKSGRPREIPILPQLQVALEGIGPRADGLVFSIPYITLRRHFLKALHAIGVADFRFHDLRHTFASNFIMTTSNLPVLQRILGHSTPTMTLRYAHLSGSHVASEMARFGAVMPLLGAGERLGDPDGAPAAEAPSEPTSAAPSVLEVGPSPTPAPQTPGVTQTGVGLLLQ